MKKVVSDRHASLDEDAEIKPAVRKLVEDEFRRGATIPVEMLGDDASEIPDRPKLTLVVADPETEWTGAGTVRRQIAEWTRLRGKSPRLYPGAIVWCFRKPGRDLRDHVEVALAWKRVAKEIADGTLGGDFDRSDRAEVQSKVKDAEEAAKDEVWGGYRFAVLADGQDPDGLKVIDLGAGHSSSGETLCGRVLAALKSEALLNESVGAGYIDRNWPPALKESGAWPLASLRQSFLNGSLTRLVDPDNVLRAKIAEFVGRGDFGLASVQRADGSFERVWFDELLPIDEVTFDAGVFLVRKTTASRLKQGQVAVPPAAPVAGVEPPSQAEPIPEGGSASGPRTLSAPAARALRLVGAVPPELWNRLGTRILPKLRGGSELRIGIDFSVIVTDGDVAALAAELRQILQDLGIGDSVRVE
jgi:hypothetical protein